MHKSRRVYLQHRAEQQRNACFPQTSSPAEFEAPNDICQNDILPHPTFPSLESAELPDDSWRAATPDSQDAWMLHLLQWQNNSGASDAALALLLEEVLPMLDRASLFRALESHQGRQKWALHSIRARLDGYAAVKEFPIECCANGCMAYCGSRSPIAKCVFCGEQKRSTFRCLSAKRRIQSAMQESWLAFGSMRSRIAASAHSPGKCRGYCDGELLKNLDAEVGLRSSDLLFIFSIDGKSLFRASKGVAWPFALKNSNLPPEERGKIENLIPLGMTPGPRHPKGLGSFLLPMINEFSEMKEGFHVVLPNGSKERVRRFLLAATGDLPAIEKMRHTRGKCGISPCGFCRIRGHSGGSGAHFPSNLSSTAEGDASMLPAVQSGLQLRPWSASPLPMRSHESAAVALSKILNTRLSKTRSNEERKMLGVGGYPAFMKLPAFRMLRSFPIGIMRLLYINAAKDMWAIWSGARSGKRGIEPFTLSRRQAPEIGADMEALADSLPCEFGRSPRSIEACSVLFIAEEWKCWVLHRSLPLLEGRLPEPCYSGWKIHVALCSLCEKSAVSTRRFEKLSERVKEFRSHCEAEYAKLKPERAGCMKRAIHCLLHLPRSLAAVGPLSASSQWSAERHVKRIGRGAPAPATAIANRMVESEKLKTCLPIKESASATSLQEENFAGKPRSLALEEKLEIVECIAACSLERDPTFSRIAPELLGCAANAVERPMLKASKHSAKNRCVIMKASRFGGSASAAKHS